GWRFRPACGGEFTGLRHQAIGRARPSRRTAENPVDVFVLTAAVIPDLPVNECVKLDDIWNDWADEDPARILIGRGVVPKSWEDRAAVVGGRFAECADPGDALQTAFRQDAEAEIRLTRAMGDYPPPPVCEFPSNANRDISIGKRRKLDAKIIKNNPKAAADILPNPGQPAPWPAFRYRRTGRRQGSLVQVRPDIADPRAEVERYLGQLSMFEPAAAKPKRPKANRVPPPAPTPDPVHDVLGPVQVAEARTVETTDTPAITAPAPEIDPNTTATTDPSQEVTNLPTESAEPEPGSVTAANSSIRLHTLLAALEDAALLPANRRRNILSAVRTRPPKRRPDYEREVLFDLLGELGPKAVQVVQNVATRAAA
ncbi:MAG: hypothetical protein WCJ64_17175, partial [Rhodospirillaceae bacterium]